MSTELSEAQIRTALKSPEHLKEWMEKSGRRFLVMDGLELVDSLPWPEGVIALTQLLACYRDHRATRETGRYETQKDPSDGEDVQIPIFKGETLELEELDRAIRYLIGMASDEAHKRGVKWDITDLPL